MANLNPCGGLSLSLNKGRGCATGYFAGAYLFETQPAAITEADAVLLSTWNTLALQDMGARLMHIKFDKSEPGEDTPVEEKFNSGSEIWDIEASKDKYSVKASLAGMSTIYGQLLTGKDFYVYFYTSKGLLVGKEVTAGTIEAVKYRVSAIYKKATLEAFPTIDLYFTKQETEWESFMNMLNPDFDPSTVSTVIGMNFKEISSSLTSITLSATDLDKVGVTSLSTSGAGNFTLYNNTTAAAVAVTSITREGNQYTLNFAAQISGDVLVVGYGLPSATSEYYELVNDLTVTL